MEITTSFDACLDLLRRLPPKQTKDNLERLIKLLPEQEKDLRNAVDLPSQVKLCPKSSREFLACDYNFYGSATYRSPWSNELVGDEQIAAVASEDLSGLPKRLRDMEILANNAFDSYRRLYYEGGISSVYLWPVKESPLAFGAAILLKKAVDDEGEIGGASWDSIHVIEAEQEDSGSMTLRMTSTVLLDIDGDFGGIKEFSLGGSMTRQHETTVKPSDDAGIVAAMGRFVEEMEGRMRSNLQEIYFGKTHEIVNELRPAALPEGFLRNQGEFRDEMRLRCGAK